MDASSEFPLVFTIYCSYYTYLSSKLLALIMLQERGCLGYCPWHIELLVNCGSFPVTYTHTHPPPSSIITRCVALTTGLI